MDAPRATLIRAVHSAVRYGSASGPVSDIWLPRSALGQDGVVRSRTKTPKSGSVNS
jgi:hypothetical protein